MPRSGTGRVYQRGNTWWLDYSFRGERFRESSGSTKKGKAVKLLRQRLAEMAAGGPMVDEENVTVKELHDLHLTDLRANAKRTKWAKTAWKHVLAFFAPRTRAVDVSTQRLKLYLLHRQKEGAANSTIQKELAAFRRAFSLAVKEEETLAAGSVPTFPSVTVKNTRKGFFTAGELAAVVKQLPAPLKPVVRFAAMTGWRKGEILGLRWGQVDFETGEIRLWTSKNDEGRVLPFRALPTLARLLEEQRQHTRAVEKRTGRIVSHVFHRDGAPIKSMRGAWNGACERAGLEGRLFHDLRRSAVRNLERAGVSRSTAMKVTGHKTESVYKRYAIADRSALEEGLGKLAEMLDGESEDRTVVPIQEGREKRA